MKSMMAVLVISFAMVAEVTAQEASPHGVPVPAGASAELQNALQNWVWRDAANEPEPPASDEEWKRRIEQRNTELGANNLEFLDSVGVSMQRETFDDVATHYLSPSEVPVENEGRLFLHLHGGAYVFGSGDTGIYEGAVIAARVGIPVLSIDYRMPPDHPFPAAVDDVVAVYRSVLESRSPDSIILGGTSAGGGLALAAVHQFKSLDLPLPAGVYAGSPAADLTKTGDTWFTNVNLDRMLVTYDGEIGAAVRLYAGEHDMKNPLISPLYGEFDGFPPTIIITGTRDLLLSDSARTHRKMRAAGVIADLHVYEGMSHAGYVLSLETPESRDVYIELKNFVNKHLK